jgi:hypothetical protein
MPNDYTLVVMIRAPTHDLSYNPQKAASTYGVGDIVDIVETSRTQPPSPTGRLGHINVTGIPNSIELQQLKEVLLRSVLIDDPTYINSGLEIDKEEVANKILIRIREWRIPVSIISLDEYETMAATREITENWEMVKTYLRKKIVVDNLDPSIDDKLIAFNDSDLA